MPETSAQNRSPRTPRKVAAAGEWGGGRHLYDV